MDLYDIYKVSGEINYNNKKGKKKTLYQGCKCNRCKKLFKDNNKEYISNMLNYNDIFLV